MAHATLPAPGTPLGPCPNACSHIDCSATRTQASQPCRYCGLEIGYETPHYAEDDGALVHAKCLHEAIEIDGRQRDRGL